MKISIITATYNSAVHIAGCLESVNSQTYKNIEHIIVDGASTDNTLEIIKSNIPKGQANRGTQLISEPDHGIYDALNKGIRLATGDIIGFLHADDTFASPTTIEAIAKEFSLRQPAEEMSGISGQRGDTPNQIDGVYGNLVFTNTKNKVVRTWQSKTFNRKNVKHGWIPPHPTLFLRKEVYEKHGLFNTSFKIAGDYDFMLRIMTDTEMNFHYLPEVITIMRLGGTSNRNLMMIARKSYEDYLALKINHVGGLNTLIMKNIRKIPQLFSGKVD
ncbi:MAG: glycosyltransferase [Prolixibacteraceae bacterium]|nr:glycosyltransferase [Prolixibacteraceae bacterium]